MANEQLVGAGEGALSGAAAGAAFGGVGAPVGAVVGAVIGYVGSNKKGYSLPWDQYNQRLQMIGNYQTQLSGATSQYATAISNLYSTAYNQWLPNAQAKFGDNGLNVNSGAFGAEAGRAAVAAQAEGAVKVADMNVSAMDKINAQYGDAWSGMFGANIGSNKAGFDNANANMMGLGQAAVGLGKLGLSRDTPANPFSNTPASNPNFNNATNASIGDIMSRPTNTLNLNGLPQNKSPWATQDAAGNPW